MKLSNKGLDLILHFEGKHRKLGDGRYIAYRCPANVWTIYAGCTEGVKGGMIVTEEQGEAMFRRELAKFEEAVSRLVRATLNQNQFDALVSFAYNCGEGALSKSGLLRKVNAGDFAGAAREFPKWVRGGGKVLPGLVTRRSREASLFMEPIAAPDEPVMPQAVDVPAETLVGSRKMTTANAGEATMLGGGVTLAVLITYVKEAAEFIKTYGVELAIFAGFVICVYFAAIKHFTRQDHEAGRYTPSGEAQ